jgi:hypothetical protein
VNTAVTIAPDAERVRPTSATSESFATRLLTTLGALCVFAMLVDIVTGAPPSFVVTVAFGAGLGLGLEVQTSRGGSTLEP